VGGTAGLTLPRPGAARVAIIGGGASGTLTAIHLLASRSHALCVTVHEASGVLGAGIAYGTTDDRHLLNVRSRHMSAFPDIPGDLVEWAATTGRESDAQAFLPRSDYADYLRWTLDRMADDRLSVSAGRVSEVEPTSDGYVVHSDAGTTQVDAVVLAHGNQAPAPLTVDGTPVPDAPWHLTDPWDLTGFDALPEEATVVLVGTGLTAVDAAITLLEGHPARRVVMTSRQGLLPFGHVEQSSTAWVSPIPSGPLTADQLAELVAEQFAAAARVGVDWRPVVDGLRAPTQSLWQRLDLDERRRFLSAHARQWEIRRHRMATGVAARIASYRDEGRLLVVPGGVEAIDDHGERAEVRLPGLPDPVFVDAVVNCTGPMTDVSRTTDPLLRSLVDRGVLTPDPLRLGVSCTPEGQILDESGQVVPGLYVVGPPRKGTLWESTAVPEIRNQAAALARVLADQVRTPA